MVKEIHTIRNFRGSDLGIIRLNKLAHPQKEKMKITIDGIEVKPIGFDTYGHPIISERNFIYYKALKANADRREDTFLTIVEYKSKPFCIREEVYDSKESIQKVVDSEKLGDLKKLLIYRKQAAFLQMPLKGFLLYGKFILADDGHIYRVKYAPDGYISEGESVKEIINKSELVQGEEVHIPGEEDICAVCGNTFTLKEVEEDTVTENEKYEKVHTKCHEQFVNEVQLQWASQIVDAVYDGNPKSEIEREWDPEDEKQKVWYTFQTNQGKVGIRFKNKVIVIKWYDNFKPFKMNIFDSERVTKFDRGIHAWSKDDAIRYLSMAKKL